VQTVDVFEEVVANLLMRGIEDELDAFATGELRCGDEITVADNEDDLGHQPLIGKRHNVQ